jgi:2-oxoglutarate dehydrogenase E2 component (dihydrolipoamide succinyltransferase)
VTIEIRVPQLPESVADAILVAWRKQPGEAVNRDENLADLETDKVVLEVPSPNNGILKEIRIQNGTTVTSGELLAVIEEYSGPAPGPAGQISAGPVGAVNPVPAAKGATAATAATPATGAAGAAGTAAASAPSAPPGSVLDAGAGAIRLSPAVRRMVEENQLDPARIPASGRDGRLTKSDVVGFLQQPVPAPSAAPATPGAAASAPLGASASPPVAARAPASPPSVARAPVSAPGAGAPAARGERRVAMTRLRQRIAERMVQAQSTQALLTSFNEVDLTAVQALRARYKLAFEREQGAKLGFMSFFVRACVEALRRFPAVNASVEGNEIVYHDFYDIGVAVSTPRGLMVPIVRDADRRSFGELEKEIAAYAARAREGTIGIEDLSGGTFTITNGGVFGSLMSTPIVNAPQSAILGMHKIQDRPMVVDGAIVVRPMMYLALTYDHRLIDGREAVQFLVVVKECLEDPGRMLLGI